MYERTKYELINFHNSEPSRSNIYQHTLSYARRERDSVAKCVAELKDKLPDDEMIGVMQAELDELQHAIDVAKGKLADYVPVEPTHTYRPPEPAKTLDIFSKKSIVDFLKVD